MAKEKIITEKQGIKRLLAKKRNVVHWNWNDQRYGHNNDRQSVFIWQVITQIHTLFCLSGPFLQSYSRLGWKRLIICILT